MDALLRNLLGIIKENIIIKAKHITCTTVVITIIVTRIIRNFFCTLKLKEIIFLNILTFYVIDNSH